jgi:hypothetical protein
VPEMTERPPNPLWADEPTPVGLSGSSAIQNDRAELSESMGYTGKPLPAAALTRKGFPAHWQTG